MNFIKISNNQEIKLIIMLVVLIPFISAKTIASLEVDEIMKNESSDLAEPMVPDTESKQKNLNKLDLSEMKQLYWTLYRLLENAEDVQMANQVLMKKTVHKNSRQSELMKKRSQQVFIVKSKESDKRRPGWETGYGK